MKFAEIRQNNVEFSVWSSATVLHNNTLFVFGGVNKPSQAVAYNLITRTWKHLPHFQLRAHHSAVLASQNVIVIFGGFEGGSRFNDLIEFNTLTLQHQLVPKYGDWPGERNAHRAVYVPLQDTMYVHGGYNGSHLLDDMWAYQVSDRKWKHVTQFPTLSKGRSSHIMTLWKRQLVIMGGDMGDPMCHIVSLDNFSHKKVDLSRSVANSYGCAYCLYNDTLYVHGGIPYGQVAGIYLNEFDLNLMKYSQATEDHSLKVGKIARHAMFCQPQGLLIIGGEGDNNESVNQVVEWIFERPYLPGLLRSLKRKELCDVMFHELQ